MEPALEVNENVIDSRADNYYEIYLLCLLSAAASAAFGLVPISPKQGAENLKRGLPLSNTFDDYLQRHSHSSIPCTDCCYYHKSKPQKCLSHANDSPEDVQGYRV